MDSQTEANIPSGSQQSPFDPALLWQRAVIAYNDAAGKEAPKLPNEQIELVTNLSEVLDLVDESSQSFKSWRNRGGTLDKARSFIGENLGYVQTIGDKLIGSATAASPIAGAIWTVATYAIKTCQQMSRSFNELLALFAKIGVFLKTLQIIEKCFPPCEQYAECVTNAFTAILKAFAIRTKYIHDGRRWIFFKSLGGADDELSRTDGEVMEAFDRISRANEYITIGNTENIKKLMGQFHVKIESIHENIFLYFRQTTDAIEDSRDQVLSGFDGLYKSTVPLAELRSSLKKYASTDHLSIQRVSGKSLSMENCYINLAVVEQIGADAEGEGKESKVEGNKPFYRLPSFEEIGANPHVLVPLQDLFKPRKLLDGRNGVPKRILICGRAGVGKTTLSKKLLYDYTQDKQWITQFSWVLWVPLRKLNQKRGRTLVDLFCELYFQQEQECDAYARTLLGHIQGQDKDKTLLILDGWDEVQRKADDSIGRILAMLLDHPNVIITSRPVEVYLGHLKGMDIKLETIGFSLEDVWAYLENTDIVASTKKASEIKEWIKSNAFVQEVVNVPIQLDAICDSWEEIKQRQEEGHRITITTLYQAIIHKMWRKDIPRLGKQDQGVALMENIINEIRNPWRLERAVQPEIALLDKLAFEEFQAGRIEFDNSKIDQIIKELEDGGVQLPLTLEHNLMKLSVLHANNYDTTGNQRSYSFIHLTFQEFFAAQWLVKQFADNHKPSQLEAYVRKYKYDPRYEVFWRFVVGLLPSSHALNSFFNWLSQEPQDLLGIQHQHLVLNLLHESRYPLDSEQRKVLETQRDEWLTFEVRNNKISTLGAQMAFPEPEILRLLDDKSTLLSAIRILLSRPVLSEDAVDRLVASMEDNDLVMQRKIALTVGRGKNIHDKIVDKLVQWLKDGKQDERLTYTTLGSQTKLPQKAIDDIVALLKDGKKGVQNLAAKALGWQANLSSETIDKIADLLEGNDPSVQHLAARALVGQTSLTVKATKALLDAADSKTLCFAAQALGRQTNSDGRIIENFLLKLLKGDNLDVQKSAANALHDRMDLLTEAVNEIVALLEDRKETVQKGAAWALFGQTNLSKPTVGDIVALLDVKNSAVQFVAAWALSGQSNLPEEAIEALFNSNNPKVREIAISALGRQKNLAYGAINALTTLLKDSNENPNTRGLAAEALASQTKNFPDEAIIILVALLNDGDAKDLAVKALSGQTNLPKNAITSLVPLVKVEAERNPPQAAWTLGQQADLTKEGLEPLIRLLDNRLGMGGQPIKRQSMVQLYDLLPTLENPLKKSLYQKCLVPRSFIERVPLYLKGNELCFYTSSKLKSIPVDEKAFRKTILDAQKAVGIPSASWLKIGGVRERESES